MIPKDRVRLDSVDTEILRFLRQDARQSNSAMAKAIRVSEATVRRRIKSLVDRDLVSIVAVPDPKKFGIDTWAMIGLSVPPSRIAAVATAVAAMKEVMFLATVAGRYDIIVGVLVRDLAGLRRFIEESVGSVKGIQRSETLVLLDLRKRMYEGPVMHDGKQLMR